MVTSECELGGGAEGATGERVAEHVGDGPRDGVETGARRGGEGHVFDTLVEEVPSLDEDGEPGARDDPDAGAEELAGRGRVQVGGVEEAARHPGAVDPAPELATAAPERAG